MAKKTPTQGNKADKNSEEKAAKEATQSSEVEKKTAKNQEKAVKPQQKGQQKPQKSTKQAPKKDGIFKKIFGYFKNVRLEIKRTTWPSRNEVFRMSLIVVGALLFFGVLIFFIDQIMTLFVKFYTGLVPSGAPAPDPSEAEEPVSAALNFFIGGGEL